MKKIFINIIALLFISTIVLADHDENKSRRDISNLDSDKRPGRFFEDQPDVTDDYQIHLIYFLGPHEKDREYDINGKAEEIIKIADEKFFKATKKKQRYKLDYRKNGKLDVTFVRANYHHKKFYTGGWNMNFPDQYLVAKGFNNPKKIYLSLADIKHKTDTGQGGFHHAWIFLKGNFGTSIHRTINHEIIHALGFAFPCQKTQERGGHMKTGILSRDGSHKFPRALYNHKKDYGCPDLKDSVYLTPTSETPFDPLNIQCALAQKARGILPDEKLEIPERYNHKKLLNLKCNQWCTYKVGTYKSDLKGRKSLRKKKKC